MKEDMASVECRGPYVTDDQSLGLVMGYSRVSTRFGIA